MTFHVLRRFVRVRGRNCGIRRPSLGRSFTSIRIGCEEGMHGFNDMRGGFERGRIYYNRRLTRPPMYLWLPHIMTGMGMERFDYCELILINSEVCQVNRLR